jgi:alkanesulfonate monooxygenase SsuD/methylene tetrahydromethanopterin reductase-like flavin-dependent oxidoreductase (luciferase family)
MKASFLATATYAGHTPAGTQWPTPPALCDRETAAFTMKATLESCRRAEELGFDWISLSEHHYAPMMLTPNPVVMAAAVSQAVRTCRIALLGPLLPLANPVRTAEEIAMVDALSDGRVTVLFLRGTPYEHRTYGDVAAASRAMTQEGIELILKAWTSEEPFAWKGEHFDFPVVSVWPRTRQAPHPPVFGSGNSDESVVFAARRKLGVGMSFASLDVLRRWIGLYREEAKKAGWTPGPEHILYRGTAIVGDSDEECRQALLAATGRDAAAMPAPEGPLAYISRPYFFGGPDAVLRQAEALCELGVGIIDMGFQAGVGLVDYEGQGRQMRIFADRVLPEIRSW